MKKLVAFVLICAIILSMCVTASAAETIPDANVFSFPGTGSTISPMAADKPIEFHLLPYDMTITNLAEQHSTYSRYYFSGSNGSLSISGTLRPSGTDDSVARNAKILLYQVGMDENIDSYSVSDITGDKNITHTFTGLNENSHYFFRIDNLNQHPPMQIDTSVVQLRYHEKNMLLVNKLAPFQCLKILPRSAE